MQRVLVHVSAAALSAVLLLAILSVAASAEANPNNRGHHYGQLKHQKAAPPSTTVQNPGSNTSPSAAIGATQVTLPALKLLPTARTAAQIKPASHRSLDPWWWLVLLLVPALLALWLLSARRLALATAPPAKPQVAPQPA